MSEAITLLALFEDFEPASEGIEKLQELGVKDDDMNVISGIPIKNTMVSPGGASRHPARDHLRAARARGAEFVLLGPLQDDLPAWVGAEWLPLVPGSDVAVMLALAHTLLTEGLLDRAFLERYCVGFTRFDNSMM